MRMATTGGAVILGLEKDIGSLFPGKDADIILVDIRQLHLQPFYHPDLLVYAASGTDVATVIINGKIVMQDRKILTFDVLQTMAEVRKLAENL
jgi:5-methylthioadenosine/S-adenosylhomocysteine deaminase